MNKFIKVLFPLVLAFAATAAMAEDGSDYAMGGAPTARAPSLIPQVSHQNPFWIKRIIADSRWQQ